MSLGRRGAQMRGQPPARIEIMIDELVLHGFAASERYAIGDALSLEIERLVNGTQSSLPFVKGVDIPALKAEGISLSAEAKPAAVGAQVGQAVFGALAAGNEGRQQ